jgi:uncharacterized protein (TIGR00251 family)
MNILEKDGAVTFSVRVIPRSSRTEIVGEYDGALKIKLKSPPVDGAANEELIRFLSKSLSVPKTHIEIVAGQAGKNKRISIQRVTSSRLKEAFEK